MTVVECAQMYHSQPVMYKRAKYEHIPKHKPESSPILLTCVCVNVIVGMIIKGHTRCGDNYKASQFAIDQYFW